MKSVKLVKSLSIILMLAMMISMLTLSAFASEENDGVAAPADTTTAADETTAAPAETTVAPADDTKVAPADTTAKEFPWDAVISLSIIVLIVVVFFIIYFVNPKFKEKVGEFVRNTKSELRKVVWSSAKDVKKNTAIVIIIVAAFAIVIGLLDLLFSQAIVALGKLF